MTVIATFYDLNTGEILRNRSQPVDYIEEDLHDGEGYIVERSNDITQYVDTTSKKIIDKQEIPCSINKLTIDADGVDEIIISNLPNPSDIEIVDMENYLVIDNTFEFTIDTPGEYKIICKSFPYLDKEYTINAS